MDSLSSSAATAALELYAREAAKAVAQAQERVNKLQQYGQELQAVAELAEDLPRRLTHDVMVPFGKHAFFPGRLVHTNELTMHLGDRYFAERTAPAVAAALRRRAARIARNAMAASDELSAHQGRLDLPAAVLQADAAAQGDTPAELRALTLEDDERMWRDAKASAATGIAAGQSASSRSQTGSSKSQPRSSTSAAAAAQGGPAARVPAAAAAVASATAAAVAHRGMSASRSPQGSSVAPDAGVGAVSGDTYRGDDSGLAAAAAATAGNTLGPDDDAETRRVMAMLARMEALEAAEEAAAAGKGTAGSAPSAASASSGADRPSAGDDDDDRTPDSDDESDGDDWAASAAAVGFQAVAWPPPPAPAAPSSSGSAGAPAAPLASTTVGSTGRVSSPLGASPAAGGVPQTAGAEWSCVMGGGAAWSVGPEASRPAPTAPASSGAGLKPTAPASSGAGLKRGFFKAPSTATTTHDAAKDPVPVARRVGLSTATASTAAAPPPQSRGTPAVPRPSAGAAPPAVAQPSVSSGRPVVDMSDEAFTGQVLEHSTSASPSSNMSLGGITGNGVASAAPAVAAAPAGVSLPGGVPGGVTGGAKRTSKFKQRMMEGGG